MNGYMKLELRNSIVHIKGYLRYASSNKGDGLQTCYDLMTRLLPQQVEK